MVFLAEHIFCRKLKHFFVYIFRSQSPVSRAEIRIVSLCEVQTRRIRMKNYKNNNTRDCGKGKRVEISIKHRRYGKIMLCEKNSNWRWHFSITLDTLPLHDVFIIFSFTFIIITKIYHISLGGVLKLFRFGNIGFFSQITRENVNISLT